MRFRLQIVFLILLCLVLTACSSAAGDVSSENESMAETAEAETVVTADVVPDLKNGYSEFIGPWAYMFYAKDVNTTYKYHDAYDGYIPKAGDLLITGEDYDGFFLSDTTLEKVTGLGKFEYWHEDYGWNGHILYIYDSTGGVLTCYEGNTIAPGQDLDVNDPDYIHKSSIDMVRVNFKTGQTYTENKVPVKPIRAVIETCFSDEFVSAANDKAAEIYRAFYADPEAVRREILNLYKMDIDWCGLFVHYLLLGTADSMS